MSALKITFPTPLPKNEKDLICMLLAGRLKDLFKGKLICAQLALDDLLKDTAGFSALGSLQGALLGMKGAMSSFQAISGYDNILNGVNQALGQIENVFSLGGLCPSPVHAPKIPDLLPQLNASLFGQAGNILNALGKLSNPSMCLGGGPNGGFGVNWNSMTGDLKNLKSAIGNFKNDPGGFQSTINAFTNNLKSQTSRLKSEVARLEKNLADPLGLNNKQNTVKSLQRAKDISDGYTVKDANGIEYANALKSMVPGDIESVFDRTGLAEQPVSYVKKEILDYCGDVIGYEKVVMSGDPAYIGWDTAPGAVNTDTPTVNPIATYANFDYMFKEEFGTIKIYDTAGIEVTNVSLARGKHYRIGLELVNESMKFYSDSNLTIAWIDGLTYSRNPAYGTDMEIITPDNTTTYVRGEIDWAVLIENPTTPDTLYWRATNNQHGNINIDPTSPKVISLEDRTYDLSMAVKKACLHLVKATASIPGGGTVKYEDFAGTGSTTARTYNTTTRIYNAAGTVTDTKSLNAVPFIVQEDTETLDELGNNNPNNRIIKSVSKFTALTYLITKKYISVENGLEYNQIGFYVSPTIDETNATSCVIMKFNDPINLLNSSKLPYTDFYSYKLTLLDKVGNNFEPRVGTVPISNSDETKFTFLENDNIIRWNITSYTESDRATVPTNEFILQTDIKINPADTKRTFIDSDPVEYRTYFYFKLPDGTAIESTTILNSTPTLTPAPTTTTATTTTPAPTPLITNRIVNYNPSINGDFTAFSATGNLIAWISGLTLSNFIIDNSEASSIRSNNVLRQLFNAAGYSNAETDTEINNAISLVNDRINILFGNNTEDIVYLNTPEIFTTGTQVIRNNKKYTRLSGPGIPVEFKFDINKILTPSKIDALATQATTSIANYIILYGGTVSTTQRNAIKDVIVTFCNIITQVSTASTINDLRNLAETSTSNLINDYINLGGSNPTTQQRTLLRDELAEFAVVILIIKLILEPINDTVYLYDYTEESV